MQAELNAEVRTFRVGEFMCATVGSKSEAAMALIKAPGGTTQRMQARLKAVEILVRNGLLVASSSGERHGDISSGEVQSSWRKS